MGENWSVTLNPTISLFMELVQKIPFYGMTVDDKNKKLKSNRSTKNVPIIRAMENLFVNFLVTFRVILLQESK